MQSLTDEQLMNVLQNNKDGLGNNALGHLYQRYASKMLSFFYFALRNDGNKAQDFVHDLFLRIIEKNASFKSDLSFKVWLYRIASNMCKNEFRTLTIEDKYRAHSLSVNTEIAFSNFSDKSIKESINSLTQDERALIVLRFKIQLSIREIAEIYECPEGTIKSRLFYATKSLSEKYKK